MLFFLLFFLSRLLFIADLLTGAYYLYFLRNFFSSIFQIAVDAGLPATVKRTEIVCSPGLLKMRRKYFTFRMALERQRPRVLYHEEFISKYNPCNISNLNKCEGIYKLILENKNISHVRIA